MRASLLPMFLVSVPRVLLDYATSQGRAGLGALLFHFSGYLLQLGQRK
jgi:hypothetical protein